MTMRSNKPLKHKPLKPEGPVGWPIIVVILGSSAVLILAGLFLS